MHLSKNYFNVSQKCLIFCLPAGHAGERFHFFNLSSFSRDEKMIKAELRWFRKKQKFYLGKSYGPHFCKVKCLLCNIRYLRKVQTSPETWEPWQISGLLWTQFSELTALCLTFQVDLYEVLDSRVKPWRGNLITSRLVPLYTQGWEVFNVTQMVTPSLYGLHCCIFYF